MACGSPLATAASERRERRVVSVLSADLVGFTSRSELIDIEDVGVLVSSYQQLLQREVESCGGVVTHFAGDGMLAIFGAPKAHEDDPERAVRAGLAICSRVAELEERSPETRRVARARRHHERRGADPVRRRTRARRGGGCREHGLAAADGRAGRWHARRRRDLPRDHPGHPLRGRRLGRGEGQAGARPGVAGARATLARAGAGARRARSGRP